MEMEDLRDPIWQRQKGESEQAYEAFSLYRDLPHGAAISGKQSLGPMPRSGVRVGQELGKSATLLERWSSRWQWVHRAEAYDRHLEVTCLEARAAARRDATERMEERRIAYRDDAANLYERLLERAHEMLTFPLAEEEVVERGDGTRVVLKPVSWSLNTLPRMLSALEQLAGYASGRNEMGALDRLLDSVDLSSLSEEQKRRIIAGENPVLVLFGLGNGGGPR